MGGQVSGRCAAANDTGPYPTKSVHANWTSKERVSAELTVAEREQWADINAEIRDTRRSMNHLPDVFRSVALMSDELSGARPVSSALGQPRSLSENQIREHHRVH
jgi:hypothetical protein